MRADQEKVRALLRDTVALLCRNGLAYDTELKIEGVIGITVNKNDVFIVHINETIANNQTRRGNVVAPSILPDSRSSFNNIQEEFEENSLGLSNHNLNSYQQSDESAEHSSIGTGADVMFVKTEVGRNQPKMEYNSNNFNNVTNQCTEVTKLSKPSTASTNGICRARKRSFVKPASTQGHTSQLSFANHSGSFGLNLDVMGYGQISETSSSATWGRLESTAAESQSVNQTPSTSRAMGMLPDDYGDSFGSPSEADLKNFLSGDVLSPQVADEDEEAQLMDQTDGGAARGTFVCEFSGCGLSFVHSYTLYRHQRTKHGRRHGAVQQQLYYCPVDQCGKVFCREGTLNNHIRDVHQ